MSRISLETIEYALDSLSPTPEQACQLEEARDKLDFENQLDPDFEQEIGDLLEDLS